MSSDHMIAVVDYGAGNVGSVMNMIKRVGGLPTRCSDASSLEHASKIILPGVGSFDTAIRKLHELNLFDVLKQRAGDGVPFLGICLGMQLLADRSEEGNLDGLSLIPGRVVRFAFDDSNLKVPHMGWNTVKPLKSAPLVNGFTDADRFYFVHSFHYQCSTPDDVLLETGYGYAFPAAIQRGHVMGVQFHPEKSHRYGKKLFENFLRIEKE